MFRFSVTTTETAQAGAARLGIAEAGTPAELTVAVLVPGNANSAADRVFADGFEAP
jgi:hypothetical protein